MPVEIGTFDEPFVRLVRYVRLLMTYCRRRRGTTSACCSSELIEYWPARRYTTDYSFFICLVTDVLKHGL